MAQHFYMSSRYRDITPKQIWKMAEMEVINLLARLRWGENQQVCPNPICGLVANHYWRVGRNQWRCRKCDRHFSVTSGTAFHSHKISLHDVLILVLTFVRSENGISCVYMSSELGCRHKTAWLNLQKLREMIIKNNDYSIPMSGTVQMDGAYFGGKRRAPNHHGKGAWRDDRAIAMKIEDPRSMRQKRFLQVSATDRRNAERRKNERLCVYATRELHPVPGLGAARTVIYVTKEETRSEIKYVAQKCVTPGAVIMTDESPAYIPLAKKYDHRTVNHSRMYQTEDGVNNNQAESYFSRARRAEYGLLHGYRRKYLLDQACEFAFREDNRRVSLNGRMELLLTMAFCTGRSTWFSKYYQGVRRIEIQGLADGRRFLGANAEKVTMTAEERKRHKEKFGRVPVIARGDAP